MVPVCPMVKEYPMRPPRRSHGGILAATLTLLAYSTGTLLVYSAGLFPAFAQVSTPAPAAEPPTQASTEAPETLLGDAGGLRTRLGAAGISFGLQDINEAWGNASGGRSRTVTYNGLTMLSFGMGQNRRSRQTFA